MAPAQAVGPLPDRDAGRSPPPTYREQAEDAKAKLDIAKETWRQCHDRDVDHTYGLMSLVKEQLGEPAIRDDVRRVLLPLFVWRYEKFDIDKHPWDEALETLMLVACEAMRGHLVGPERTGDMELIELEDRYILRFDPCGSGQRTIRGDWIEGTPRAHGAAVRLDGDRRAAHLEPRQPGVCLYCVHCIMLMEEMPMDRFGYPVRVIDPPDVPRHEPRPERPPEVPVADVQGPDHGPRGVLHARRPGEAGLVRLQGHGRPGAADDQRGYAGRRLTLPAAPIPAPEGRRRDLPPRRRPSLSGAALSRRGSRRRY